MASIFLLCTQWKSPSAGITTGTEKFYLPVASHFSLMEFLVLQHPAGRSLRSDWSINSFIMVVYENCFLVMLWAENSDWTFLIILFSNSGIIHRSCCHRFLMFCIMICFVYSYGRNLFLGGYLVELILVWVTMIPDGSLYWREYLN